MHTFSPDTVLCVWVATGEDRCILVFLDVQFTLVKGSEVAHEPPKLVSTPECHVIHILGMS